MGSMIWVSGLRRVLMVMEVLTRMIEAASSAGLISGFSLRRSGSDLVEIKVSHLLFADDTIVFCDDDCEQIVNLRCILIWFQAVSGLSVNLSKSSILPVGHVDNVQILARDCWAARLTLFP